MRLNYPEPGTGGPVGLPLALALCERAGTVTVVVAAF
jgi:hypothetical protein